MTTDQANNNTNNAAEELGASATVPTIATSASTEAGNEATLVSAKANPKKVDQRYVVLAPMVRTGGAPLRMLSLKYGADLVWGPETVDKAVIGSQRIFDPKTNMVNFMKGSEKSVFSTHTSEKERLIFQLGTANKDLAVQAAKMVARDVAGIGVNAGCPKHFSVHAGMGAALMKNPQNLLSILKDLIEHVGPKSEYAVPISVKIRLHEKPEDTFELISTLCDTGIHNLTLHCRTIPMRPRERAIRHCLQRAADICREKGVLFYVNGDVENRDDAEKIMESYKIDGGAMIATAAESNPSCFRSGGDGGLVDRLQIAQEFLQISMDTVNHISNTKYCILNLLPGSNESRPERDQLARCCTHKEMCEVLGMKYTMSEDADKGTPKQQKRKKAAEKELAIQQEQRLKKQQKRQAEELDAVEQANKKQKLESTAAETHVQEVPAAVVAL